MFCSTAATVQTFSRCFSLLLSVSADGSLLAVGSHDNFIYLYNVSERGRKYSRYGKCTVSNSSTSCRHAAR